MDAHDTQDTPTGCALGLACKGFRGKMTCMMPCAANGRQDPGELELRLIELGFIEGVDLEILHEAPFGRDPIAVRVGGATVALRRRDAMAILAE